MLDEFFSKVNELVGHRANEKGYSYKDEDHGEDLLRFVRNHFPGHALGEVVYKAVRYQAKGNGSDLVKIAAWAYLQWREDGCPGTQYEPSTHAERYSNAKAPTEMPVLGTMRRYMDDVESEALRALDARPAVALADPVRLAALVAEEAGEAVKAALDSTRGLTTAEAIAALRGELIQTAAMALIALCVLGGRGLGGDK